MNKEQLWKALHEPGIKDCRNCKHSISFGGVCSLGSPGNCKESYIQLPGEKHFYSYWEWDEKTK